MKKKTIQTEVVVSQDIQKSKFIAYLCPIQSEADAKLRLQQIKKEHPKAAHHCSAFVIGDISRSNDDGEPASSAGMPMLQVLQGHDLDGVLAVVVRYFGGILLGVGGLIRAYGSSVTQAVQAAQLWIGKKVYHYQLRFKYAFINDVENHLQHHGIILDREYSEDVVYNVDITDPQALEALNDLTRGTITIQYIREYERLIPEGGD